MTFVIVIAIALIAITLLKMRQRLALLAAQIRELRAHALQPVTYRKLSTSELDDPLLEVTREADELGLSAIGDYVETGGRQELSLRFFADAGGTTFGWVSPFDVAGKRHIVIAMFSHELATQTITTRQPSASMLVRPPFVTMHNLPPATSLATLLAKHRAHAGLDDAHRAFVPVHSFEEVERELARMRDKAIAWRKEQPADELLEADLKSLLGPQYSKLSEPLKRRLV